MLVLDEATSSLDTRTEVLVQKAMRALRSDRTSLVIAHRLSMNRDANLILVMEGGRIVEQGTHASLLAAGGLTHGFTRPSSRHRCATEHAPSRPRQRPRRSSSVVARKACALGGTSPD